MKKEILLSLTMGAMTMGNSLVASTQPLNIPTTIPTTVTLTVEEKEDQQHAQTTVKIANHLSQVMNSFFDIAKNPHNSAQVGHNIAGILESLVKICFECVKRFHISADSTPEQLEELIMKLEAELYEQLNAVVIKRSQELLES